VLISIPVFALNAVNFWNTPERGWSVAGLDRKSRRAPIAPSIAISPPAANKSGR
jgi:hypothetical protein